MRIPLQRQQLLWATILVMWISLFISRAFLSISLMLFVAAACVHKDIGKQLIRFVKTPLLVGISLLFLLPFISGLWSSNTDQWQDIMRIKLPLLILPIAFAGSWQLSKKQWAYIAIVLAALIFIATGWSMTQYILHRTQLHQAYLQAKVIPTPLENDHVRFSWLVAIGVVICYILVTYSKKRLLQIVFAAVGIWFIIYLHILSARTGLLSFYIILLLYGLWLLFTQKHIVRSILVAVILISMPLIAWYVFPTFQNRIKYFVYDFSYVKSHTYLPGANDGNRVLSLKAGAAILQQYPLGVGAGDVTDSTLYWYHTHIHHMLPTDQLVLPSSEWLIYGAAAGWPGIIVLTIVMFVPLFITHIRNRFAGWAISMTAAASLLFDIGLEVQYGVFLYAVILLSYWKWATQKERNT